MKKMAAILSFILLPLSFFYSPPARATLFNYDFSVVMLAEYLFNPAFFGDKRVGVTFFQETTLDYPQFSFVQPRQPFYQINNGSPLGGFWSLSEISLMDYRIWVGDAGGNVYMDLLYDHDQSENAPFREPDRLLVKFGVETSTLPGVCNTPTTGPCPIGTGGTHTFNQGEFSFERRHVELASIAEPNALLLTGAGLVAAAIQMKKRSRRKMK